VDPHTQDDIDRAIAAFNRQYPRKAPAPPEGYTLEHVSHCFHAKYDLPENLHARFVEVVSSHVTKNPKPYTMKLETAVDRALLRIHESLSEENGRQIPERKSSNSAPKTAYQEFFEKVAKHLQTTYSWVTPLMLDGFISKYSSMPIEQLFFSESTLDAEGNRLRVMYAFSDSHFHHADYFFRTSFINPFALIGFHDGVLPFSALHPSFHSIIQLATIQLDGNVMNAYVFVYKSACNLCSRLQNTLIQESQQSDPIFGKWDLISARFVKVGSDFKTGDILLVMPERILKRDSRPGFTPKQVAWRAGGGSSYGDACEIGKQITDNMPPESHKVVGGKFDWKESNAVILMSTFQKFMLEFGGKNLRVEPI